MTSTLVKIELELEVMVCVERVEETALDGQLAARTVWRNSNSSKIRLVSGTNLFVHIFLWSFQLELAVLLNIQNHYILSRASSFVKSWWFVTQPQTFDRWQQREIGGEKIKEKNACSICCPTKESQTISASVLGRWRIGLSDKVRPRYRVGNYWARWEITLERRREC